MEKKPKTTKAPKKEAISPMGDKILVVIPYYAQSAQGREIEFAIAGWRKHFKEEHQIVVVGDRHPAADAKDVVFIDCPRVDGIPGQYTMHLDHVNKIRKVREMFPETKGFIFAADDKYAVNDFDLTDVRFLKMLEPTMSMADANSDNMWLRDLAKTKSKCEEKGWSANNYVCHLPIYYEWDRLFALFDEFNMGTNSYVIENLYFNKYYGDRVALTVNFEYDNLRCPILRSDANWARLPRIAERKIWIYNSPEGYQKPLEEFLAKHYGI